MQTLNNKSIYNNNMYASVNSKQYHKLKSSRNLYCHNNNNNNVNSNVNSYRSNFINTTRTNINNINSSNNDLNVNVNNKIYKSNC
jgi:hypothetical protein